MDASQGCSFAGTGQRRSAGDQHVLLCQQGLGILPGGLVQVGARGERFHRHLDLLLHLLCPVPTGLSTGRLGREIRV